MRTHFARMLVVVSVLILFLYSTRTVLHDIEYQVVLEAVTEQEVAVPKVASTTFFFVGDIMLGRSVESIIELEGFSHPFIFSSSTIAGADVAVGNFEGIVPEEHIQTPGMGFQFSIKEAYLGNLRNIGFDVLSLGNNHSYDFGESALKRTRGLCLSYELLCIGSPREIDEYATTIITRDTLRTGIISFETVFGYPDSEALREAVLGLASSTDIQFAYVHWGNEYELEHTKSQEIIAHALIDAGIDAVIGHHPHVVQDIAIYKGKPIFYSLGNFIFDQYFSPEVQEHLAVKVRVEPTQVTYELNMYTSTDTPSQPQVASNQYRDQMMSRIFLSTTTIPFLNDERWYFTIPRD